MAWSYEACGPLEAENNNSFLLSLAENQGEQTQQDTDHLGKVLAAGKEFGNMCQIFKK